MSADRWMLVPVEPTQQMIAAFQDRMLQEFGMLTTAGYHARVYAAMLAAAPAAPASEPVARPMTSDRARYFMERFLHEEKLLGPNEQAALHYVIAMLEAPRATPAQSREPLTDEQIEAALGPCDDSDMGRHLRSQYIASFKRVYARLHGIGSKP